MSEIEKMQRYIDRTDIPDFEKYHMTEAQMQSLTQEIREGPMWAGVLYTAFACGLAKGYRAAKAERRTKA